MKLSYKLSKWYICIKIKHTFWHIRYRAPYYFFLLGTIPARTYCFIRGYNYKDWIWEKIEDEIRRH